MLVQGMRAIDRVNGDDDAIEPVFRGDETVRHQGMQNRNRRRQPRGFDNDTIKLALAAFGETPGDVLERLLQIAADRAAQAAAAHFHYDVFLTVRHQQMVQTDLAEFIDDDQRVFQLRLGHQIIEQGSLAAAEKTGQQRYRHQGSGFYCHGRKEKLRSARTPHAAVCLCKTSYRIAYHRLRQLRLNHCRAQVAGVPVWSLWYANNAD